MRRALDLLAPILFVALLLGVWELTVRALKVPSYLLPAPRAIFSVFQAEAARTGALAARAARISLGAGKR